MKKMDDEKALPKERGKHTVIEPLPPDDPIFGLGPVVGGRVIGEEHGCTSIGSLPHDHPIYRNVLIFGRPATKKEEGEDD